jgi:hypothetical protein
MAPIAVLQGAWENTERPHFAFVSRADVLGLFLPLAVQGFPTANAGRRYSAKGLIPDTIRAPKTGC